MLKCNLMNILSITIYTDQGDIYNIYTSHDAATLQKIDTTL